MNELLTEKEIDRLFAFCKKHYVRHYDLQVELVDHLANAIEALREKDPGLSFESALEKVYAGFGIRGFAEVIRQRQESLALASRKERWRIFSSYFTWPKALLTMALFSLVFLLPLLVPTPLLKSILLGAVLLFIFYDLSRLFNFYRRRKQKLPLLLTENCFAGLPFAGLAVNIIINIYNGVGRSLLQDRFGPWTFLVLASLLLVLLMGSLAHQSYLRELFLRARKRYPLAFE